MHGVYYLHQQTMSHKDCILRLSACTINHCHSGDCSPHDHISTSIKFAENNMLYMFVPHLIGGVVQLQSSQMASLLNTSSSCRYNSKQQAELHRSRPNRYMRHRFKSHRNLQYSTLSGSSCCCKFLVIFRCCLLGWVATSENIVNQKSKHS